LNEEAYALNPIVDVDAWLNISLLQENLPHVLAVGWSGGLDSTALLLCLHHQGYAVQAWHIDHAWHKQSAKDATLLEQRAQSWGIPFFSRRLLHTHQSNREAQARQGRYDAFQSLAAETGIHNLALAHHADDQAETVCMRMLQGAGVMGLRGMQHQSSFHKLTIHRPFLDALKEDIQQAMMLAQLPWLDDISNKDVSLWRNKIRLLLLPAMQAHGIDSRQLWLRWQQQALRVSQDIEAGLYELRIHPEERGCWIDYPSWHDLQESMRVQMIQRMAASTLGVGKVLGRRHMILIECWRKKGAHGGLDLSGCRLYRQGVGLHLQLSAATSRPCRDKKDIDFNSTGA